MAEHDRRKMDEIFAGIQAERARLPALAARVAVCLAAFVGCTGAEYFAIFSVVDNAIGAVAGEPASAAPAVISFGGLICVAAFALRKREAGRSVPARVLAFLPAYIALAFVLVMGIELADLFRQNMNSDVVLDLPGAGEIAAAEPSLLDRFFAFMSGPFALVFGLTTLCSLYVAEAALTRLRSSLRELHSLHSALREARTLKAESDECECGLGALDVKRLEISRGLHPAATAQYANELAVAVADALAPFDAFVFSHQMRRKKPASILRDSDEGETDIDIAKFAAHVALLRLDAKSINAAINPDHNPRARQ